MGGSVGVGKYDCEFSKIFLDDRLRSGETLLKRNAIARASFVEFIKSGEWMDKVSVFEDFVRHNIDEHSSLFERFGYNNPHCLTAHTKFSPAKSLANISSASIRTQSDSDDYSSGCISPSKRDLLADSYGAFSECHLFEENRTKCVMIAALLPVYLTTTAFKELAQKHGWEFEDKYHGPLQRTKTIHNKQRSERLQEWLLGAAAMFDGSQLEEYLADPCGSWVEDYKRALTGLPVVLTLSAVDHENQESKVIFSNTGADSYTLSDAAHRAGSSKLNRDMHSLFSTHLSPADAEHVTKAVFDAETYRRSFLNARGATQLRAVKPIFNAQGAHVYTLGLESQPFADPLALQDPLVAEERFQQMEDLLSLLPMLIRC